MSWVFYALIASIVIGSQTVVLKKVLVKEHALDFLAFSAIIGLILVIPLGFYIKPLPFNIYGLILLKSLFAAAFFYLSGRSLRHLEISTFAPLTNLTLIFLVFLSFIFGEALTATQIGGIGLIIIGTYILELKDGFKKMKEPFEELRNNKYIKIMLLGLVFASLAAMLDRIILKQVALADYYFYQRVFIDIFILASLVIFFDWRKSLSHCFKTSKWWILLATILFLTGDYFYFKALTFPFAFAALVIGIKRLSTLFATILGGEIFHEDSLFRKGLACAIMIAGVFLIVY